MRPNGVIQRKRALQDAGPVAGATEAMSRLVALGVLKDGSPYVDVVRFRNLIVHEYEAIKPEILYELDRVL